MPTEKPRVTFTISREKLSELESYQHDNKIKNQTQAILSLLDKGISDYLSKRKTAPLYSSEAMRLAGDYDTLDSHGKKIVRLVADEEKARIEAEQAKLQDEKKTDAEATEEIIYFSVPGFIASMSAGTGQPAGMDYPEDYELTKKPPRGTTYIARVGGHSMEPTYQYGDRLFVHYCEEIAEGQIGVFLMDGQQWVKELGDGVLISHNPEYDPIPMREDIKCQGLVLGVCDDSYFQ